MKKIAIITGASSGIGKEFATTLKNHGTYDEVWAVARNSERLEELKKEIPFPVKAISLDLSSPDAGSVIGDMLKAADTEEKSKGSALTVGILINCSGFGIFAGVKDTHVADSLGMIDLNCRALTAVTLAVLPYMEKGSEIINIASVAGFQPIPYINIYGATKAYVLSFSRALAREVKKDGIRVLAVCPFWTKTRFFDRAIDKNGEAVVKKYVAMYTPDFIVKKAWRALERTRRDYVVPGFKAAGQVFLVKLLPHSLVMNIWMSQQKLK
ncbi:MAG: SDR family NAD(P)-dependent oxidoreductase [Clostridia bacterium]|nr:SDR family NAD(P)-dependent oxidoreductase [Clostridia bacterium]